jgi:hypothetical protein
VKFIYINNGKKMKKLFWMLTCLFPVAANSAVITDISAFNNSLSVIDGFEDLSSNDFAQNRDGYTISSPLQVRTLGILNPTGPNVLTNFTFGPDVIPFSFYFDSVVSQAGALWETDINNILTIQAFLNGALVEQASFTETGCCNSPSFFGFTGINFDTLTMSSLTGTGNVFVDNVAFTNVASVPEPASFALLSLGLAGLGFSRRKKTS